MDASRIKNFVMLYGILFLYSVSGICAKFASKHSFLSTAFILFYGFSIFLLVIYSFFWQQILKVLPLTTAFSNKALLIVLGMLWGFLFFGEKIEWNMILGAVVIFVGINVVAKNE